MTADELLALLDDFPWAEYAARLHDELLPIYRDLVVVGGTQGAAALGNVAFNADDPFLSRFATKYVGERIVQLTGSSKDAVVEAIRMAFDRNEGADIATLSRAVTAQVEDTVAGWQQWRALRLARTESAIALNHGNALGFAQNGIEEVTIRDGVQDPECAKANGQVWPLKRWLAEPIAHPNCERSASAKLTDEQARALGFERHNPQGPDGRFIEGKGGPGGGNWRGANIAEAEARRLAYERFQADPNLDALAEFCALMAEVISVIDDPCGRALD